ELKKDYTIVIVTHNMQQAARVSDLTAFLLNGKLVEFSPTRQLFTTPADARTEAYITGRFGWGGEGAGDAAPSRTRVARTERAVALDGQPRRAGRAPICPGHPRIQRNVDA